MSLDISKALASIAPTLAAMLGGPLAGTAVTALEGAFGLASGAGPDGITNVMAGNLTPDQLAAVRKADQEHADKLAQMKIDVQKLNLSHIEALAATDVQDRVSARSMQVSTRSYLVPMLAVLVVGGFASVIGLRAAGYVAGDDAEMHDLLLTLKDAVLLVLSFYFGSSAGAQHATALLAQAPAIDK